MDQVIVNFLEGSYQYRSVEVSNEGSVLELFDAISNEFRKQQEYRRSQHSLWADIYNVIDGQKIHTWRCQELTSTTMRVTELTKGVGFEPTESPVWYGIHVTTNPLDLEIIQEL